MMSNPCSSFSFLHTLLLRRNQEIEHPALRFDMYGTGRFYLAELIVDMYVGFLAMQVDAEAAVGGKGRFGAGLAFPDLGE